MKSLFQGNFVEGNDILALEKLGDVNGEEIYIFNTRFYEG